MTYSSDATQEIFFNYKGKWYSQPELKALLGVGDFDCHKHRPVQTLEEAKELIKELEYKIERLESRIDDLNWQLDN